MIKPLSGAYEFIDWLRTLTQLIVVSDTFTEFAYPVMKQLGKPTLLCHNLTVDTNGTITDYNLRQKNAKLKVVEALQNLNYKVIAIGDSYNDISMLRQAEHGLLFNPPQNVIDEFGDLLVFKSYNDLKKRILHITDNKL
jgi:phosphoserine/homoserine phosphotransferase